MDRGSTQARSIAVDLAPDKRPDKLYPPRISESAETIMAIDFYPFNSHHQILDNGITFFGVSSYSYNISFNQGSTSNLLFLLHHDFSSPLINNGVNSWLHLGMISSLRGIKELIDQVPVFLFLHNNSQKPIFCFCKYIIFVYF